jgi:dCTP deaminase
MILTGSKIQEECAAGRIRIVEFRAEHVSTNAYDLRLGSILLRYTEPILDPRAPNAFEEVAIPATGLCLSAGEFVLGASMEAVGSDHYVPLIHAKSGTARLGLFVHVTADLIDIGSHGCVTFQMFATAPVVVWPGMRIAQVTFWKPLGDIELYKGKYMGSKGPRPSLSYLDAGAVGGSFGRQTDNR